jgi:hypothetical protein
MNSIERIPLLLAALAMVALLSSCETEPLSGSVSFTIEGSAALPDELQAVAIDWTEEVTWTRQVMCEVDSRLGDSAYRVAAADRSVGGGVGIALAIQAYDGPQTYDRDQFQPTTAMFIGFEAGEPADDPDEPDIGRDERDDDDSAMDDDDSAMDDDDIVADDDDSVMDDDDSAMDDDDIVADDDDSVADDDDDLADDDDSVADDDDDLADDDDSVADDDDSVADDDDIATDDDDVEADGTWELDSSAGGLCTFTVNEDGLSGSFVCQEVPIFLDGALHPDEASVNGQWSCSELQSNDAIGPPRFPGR